MFAFFCVYVVLCRSRPCKEFYRLSARFRISDLILNMNRPKGLIRQGGIRRIMKNKEIN
jgi:hypothetical protein